MLKSCNLVRYFIMSHNNRSKLNSYWYYMWKEFLQVFRLCGSGNINIFNPTLEYTIPYRTTDEICLILMLQQFMNNRTCLLKFGHSHFTFTSSFYNNRSYNEMYCSTILSQRQYCSSRSNACR